MRPAIGLGFVYFLVCNLSQASARTAFWRPNRVASSLPSQTIDGLQNVVDIRGGATRQRKKKAKTASLSSKSSKKTATGKKVVGAAKEEKTSALSNQIEKYKKILPLTRIYITVVGITTLLGMILGEELTQSVLSLDPMRVFYGMQIWRPFTAATFLGPPSIGWLLSAYYLVEYGSSLERAFGSAQHLVFLITQILMLSTLSVLTGSPFFAPSLVTSMLHVLSRATPHQKVGWLIFKVPYWALPYGLMASDVLQAQNPMAATSHILGILSGHFYHFHKNVWPKLGGEDWLVAPDWLVRRFDPDARKEKDRISKSLKNRKRNKGRKLGSS